MAKGRVLVVDDLPDWRKTLANLLGDEGYQVFLAGSRDEAQQVLAEERIHVAVLDVRLDESDEDNREGLELMRQIKGFDPTILVIILTGYADVAMVQAALRPQSNGLSLAYSFVEKEKSYELPEFVRNAFEHEIKINWDLDIQADGDLLEQLPARLRFTGQHKPPVDQLQLEFDELLRKLFFSCDSIRLRPLSQGFSGAVVVRVEPHYHSRGRGESVVAKLGRWPLIDQEARNFTEIQGAVGGHRLPQLLNLTRTSSLGGLIYSFAGLGEPTSFVDFYTRSAPDEILPVLDNLFLETCFPWGRDDKLFRPAFDFTAHYFSHLQLNRAKLDQALANLFGKRHYLAPADERLSRLQFLEHTLPNPVAFVLNHSLAGPAYLSLIHGDLTGYNVILDGHADTWLIDFARTGQGPLLQDFASFENFIKFSLLEANDPGLFYRWERELIGSSTLEPPPSLTNLALPPPLQKAHQLILAIRRLAYRVSGNDHLVEYLTGLLFHALKLTTIMQLPPLQRDLAMVSAAIVCERLTVDRI